MSRVQRTAASVMRVVLLFCKNTKVYVRRIDYGIFQIAEQINDMNSCVAVIKSIFHHADSLEWPPKCLVQRDAESR